jgi:hypothetical protein
VEPVVLPEIWILVIAMDPVSVPSVSTQHVTERIIPTAPCVMVLGHVLLQIRVFVIQDTLDLNAN